MNLLNSCTFVNEVKTAAIKELSIVHGLERIGDIPHSQVSIENARRLPGVPSPIQRGRWPQGSGKVAQRKSLIKK
jgi:hypothetical protein